MRNQPWNIKLVEEQSQILTLLFVGPIAPSQNQLTLVKMAAILRVILHCPFQLVLIGEFDNSDSYVALINEEIVRSKLKEYIHMIEKPPQKDLYAWYRASDIFICISEENGFYESLIEAIDFNIPVIAQDHYHVRHLLNNHGILIRNNNPAAIAALVKLLLHHHPLRTNILPHQKESKPLHYQIDGSFETSYSLDLVNREIALALEKNHPHQVGIYATKGYGDYIPNENSIRQYPGIEELWHKGCKENTADVVIRNLYPPRVSDMNNPINFLYFAWEESELPLSWIHQFNRKLDGMPAPSHYVARVLRNNGIVLPISVIGEGADHVECVKQEPFHGNLGKGFKFLHISSCFPRKGIDILLESFARAFTTKDSVTLIIKTFPNPHNTAEQQIATLNSRYPKCPPIILINKDLPQGQIKDLYLQCDAFVAPTRGEGFGLPMAEAMWLGRPVITTAYGGQSDFCTDETAWLIDFDFALADTHFGLNNSVWVEPKIESLISKFHEVYFADKKILTNKALNAQNYIKQHFTWKYCAEKLSYFEKQVKKLPITPALPKKLTWISPWNVKCGIAAYSSFLIDELDPMDFDITILASKSHGILKNDTSNIKRCWQECSGDISELIRAIEESQPDIIMIQYNFGFFSFKQLATMIEKFATHNIPILITLHRTEDVSSDVSLGQIRNSLSNAARLLVHGVNDLNRLKNWGLIENVTLIPHGIKKHKISDKISARDNKHLPADDVIIASYGFLFPHKGIEQLLLAFPDIIAQIPNARLLLVNALYPNGASDKIYQRCKNLIENSKWSNRIHMITDFLEDEESMAWLACADLCVFAYQHTAESSSAAARYGVSSIRPVACTPLSIFNDIQKCVHYLPGIKPDEIAKGIINLLSDQQQLKSKYENQCYWIDTISWEKVAYKLFGMMKGILQGENI